MAMIETFRRIIDPKACDILGHMNIGSYFSCVSDAGFGLMTAFGMGRDQVLGGRRQGFAVVHSDANYHREVLAGDWVYIRSGIVEIGRRSTRFHHRMFRADDDRLLFDVTVKCVLMDLEKRRAAVLDEDLKQAMRAFLIEAG